MKLSDFIIGLIVFCVVMVALTTVWSGVTESYSADFVGNVSSEYNKLNQSLSTALEIQKEIENINKTASDDVEDSMIRGSYSAIKLGLKSFDVIKGVIWQVQRDFGIPSYFVTALVAVILIVMSFAVINALFKRKV